jgi:hypothetical protein
MKGEICRQRREQEAYMQSTLEETEPPAWDQIAPLLDEAMGRLGETDRNALVLRYFENQSAAQIGETLQMTEDTARRRVNRALEKLRRIFSKRGVTLTTALIAGAVSANSVQAAPVGLAATISARALDGSAVTASTLTLVKGTLQVMKWLQIKFAAGLTAVILAAGGVATMATLTAPAASSPPDQKAAARLLQAVQNDDYGLFMQDGDAAFQTLSRQNLDSVSQQLAKRLQAGYELVFLGELKQNGYHVTLWKISFKDGGDDVLEKLSTKAGKVGGVWLE